MRAPAPRAPLPAEHRLFQSEDGSELTVRASQPATKKARQSQFAQLCGRTASAQRIARLQKYTTQPASKSEDGLPRLLVRGLDPVEKFGVSAFRGRSIRLFCFHLSIKTRAIVPLHRRKLVNNITYKVCRWKNPPASKISKKGHRITGNGPSIVFTPPSPLYPRRVSTKKKKELAPADDAVCSLARHLGQAGNQGNNTRHTQDPSHQAPST